MSEQYEKARRLLHVEIIANVGKGKPRYRLLEAIEDFVLAAITDAFNVHPKTKAESFACEKDAP